MLHSPDSEFHSGHGCLAEVESCASQFLCTNSGLMLSADHTSSYPSIRSQTVRPIYITHSFWFKNHMQLCVSIVSFGPNCLVHFLVEQTRTLTQRSTRERKDKRSPAVHRKNQAMSKVCLIVLHWWFSCTASTKLLVDTGCMAVAYVMCRSHWLFSHSCNTFFFFSRGILQTRASLIWRRWSAWLKALLT